MSEDSLKTLKANFCDDSGNDRDDKKFLDAVNQLKENKEFIFDSDDSEKFEEDIKKIRDQVGNLKVPTKIDFSRNSSTDFLTEKRDLIGKINQIILDVHSFIEKHGITENLNDILVQFISKLDDFSIWLLLCGVYIDNYVQLDKNVLKDLYQIFDKLKNIDECKVYIECIKENLILYKTVLLDTYIQKKQYDLKSLKFVLSNFFDIDFDSINEYWVISFKDLVVFINESKDEKIKKTATDEICQFLNMALQKNLASVDDVVQLYRPYL